MTIEQFTSAIRAEPFRPFILHTTSAKEYRVDHPELAMRTPGGRTVVVNEGENAAVILDLLLIEAISFQEAPPSRKTKPESPRNQ